MITCPYCNSPDMKLRRTRLTLQGEPRYQYECQSCHKYNTSSVELGQPVETFSEPIETFVRTDEWIKNVISGHTNFVITSVQSNTEVDEKFFDTLERYCKVNAAQLLVVPIRYGVSSVHEFPDFIKDYLVENNFQLAPKLRVLGQLKISATAENPLTGLDAISQGDSIVVGHNQLQMKTLPVNSYDFPVIMTSTGTLSKNGYSATKSGYKATFNHSMSAVRVTVSKGHFHLRHLNWDGECFHDLWTRYDDLTDVDSPVSAIVTGDEHAIFMDPVVKQATYTGPYSMTELLEPEYVVRHDLLDCYAVSHHHKKNVFIQYAKNKSGMNQIERELERTMDHVYETTLANQPFTNIIVSSNHNDHLTQWLTECEPKEEPWNALFYHKMMYEILSKTKMGLAGAEYPSAFRLFAEPLLQKHGIAASFVGRREQFKIEGIEVANHGDRGSNGSRGSRKQFSQLPSKTIIGHSHSPGIEKGCYQVGTSSYLNLEYSSGPSSWLHTHCIIHKNGKRQLVNIINGEWF